MDIDRYRREMLSVEAPPELAEKTIAKILREEKCRNACKPEVLPAGPQSLRLSAHASAARCLSSTMSHRRPRTVAKSWRVAACLAACLALCLGVAAPLSTIVDLQAASARAPKDSMENIRLEAASTMREGDSFIIDAEATLCIFFGNGEAQTASLQLDDDRFCLIDVKDDLLADDSLNFGDPFDTEFVEGEARFIVRMRLKAEDEVARRLIDETEETASYRPYAILKTVTDALKSSTLTLVDEHTGESTQYGFDIERFEEQWDYSHQLRGGIPVTISLERKGECDA